MIQSWPVLLFLWTKFEGCEIDLGCYFMIRKKNVVPETPLAENQCFRGRSD